MSIQLIDFFHSCQWHTAFVTHKHTRTHTVNSYDREKKNKSKPIRVNVILSVKTDSSPTIVTGRPNDCFDKFIPFYPIMGLCVMCSPIQHAIKLINFVHINFIWIERLLFASKWEFTAHIADSYYRASNSGSYCALSSSSIHQSSFFMPGTRADSITIQSLSVFFLWNQIFYLLCFVSMANNAE